MYSSLEEKKRCCFLVLQPAIPENYSEAETKAQTPTGRSWRLEAFQGDSERKIHVRSVGCRSTSQIPCIKAVTGHSFLKKTLQRLKGQITKSLVSGDFGPMFDLLFYCYSPSFHHFSFHDPPILDCSVLFFVFCWSLLLAQVQVFKSFLWSCPHLLDPFTICVCVSVCWFSVLFHMLGVELLHSHFGTGLSGCWNPLCQQTRKLRSIENFYHRSAHQPELVGCSYSDADSFSITSHEMSPMVPGCLCGMDTLFLCCPLAISYCCLAFFLLSLPHYLLSVCFLGTFSQ